MSDLSALGKPPPQPLPPSSPSLAVRHAALSDRFFSRSVKRWRNGIAPTLGLVETQLALLKTNKRVKPLTDQFHFSHFCLNWYCNETCVSYSSYILSSSLCVYCRNNRAEEQDSWLLHSVTEAVTDFKPAQVDVTSSSPQKGPECPCFITALSSAALLLLSMSLWNRTVKTRRRFNQYIE